MTKTCTRDLTITVLSDGGNAVITGDLTYSAQDPFAVALTLHPSDDPQDNVRWLLSRDLLLAGMTGPAGDGDVRLRPATGSCDRRIIIDLDNGTDIATIALPLWCVAEFLENSFTAVPRGSESSQIDFDAMIDVLTH